MIAPMQLEKEIRSHAIDYRALMAQPTFKKVISDRIHDINMFIPVRKRLKFLRPLVEHLKAAAKKASMNVRIVIIENDESPIYESACICHGVDYIFIPTDENRSCKLFEKSLCYNVGFLCTPRTDWAIYHDLDILVDDDYFVNLKKHLVRNPKWLQPYCKKRVRMLSNWATTLIIDGTYEKTREWLIDNSCPSKPGSPGGSVVVRSDDFLSVGGYDPEIFFGYSPEDAFFWVKLEILYNAYEGIIKSHFLGSATYADDPLIEVYHMEHPSASDANPRYGWMLEILESFYLYDNKERHRFVSMKKEFLNAVFT